MVEADLEQQERITGARRDRGRRVEPPRMRARHRRGGLHRVDLCERLLGEGRGVVGLDNFDPFYPESHKQANLAAVRRSDRFALVRADLRDAAAVRGIFSAHRIDAVVHLAALAGVRPSLERPAEYADVNVRGTGVLLEAAVRAGGPRVVFASSSSVYGERSDGPFRESDPVERPVSPYAATKRAGELLAHTFHHAWGLSVTCARIFTAYGPRQRPDLAIRKFAERLLAGKAVPVFGDGSSQRDFTYVDDLVEGWCARSTATWVSRCSTSRAAAP